MGGCTTPHKKYYRLSYFYSEGCNVRQKEEEEEEEEEEIVSIMIILSTMYFSLTVKYIELH